MLFASNFDIPNSDTQAIRDVAESLAFGAQRPAASQRGLLMRVRDKASVFALAVDIVPERPAAAVEQALRRAIALDVPNALADPIALVLCTADKIVKTNLLMPLPVQPRSQNAWQASEAGTRSVMKAAKQCPQLRTQRTQVGHRAMSEKCQPDDSARRGSLSGSSDFGAK
jgi:hypothetical protein